ncbi:thioredoxin family protein [Neolewinella antarctica]|uniref:Thiol-disulfide isomerase/thioredoxin n=1 Tax=Neolewinella antarctica TaxID=442734 RepID=A0ABX0X9Q6_9BACT|nr:thioredoxin domain-containing protein [Neolewinella antarctica]NJC25745.1 thiol-disulfide isomerase/thioredoxin [Neolewinella antarctica]
MRALLLLFSVLTLALAPIAIGAQNAGVAFTEKPFAELLAQAKAEDKLIFIDAYTTWCGPCKMMSAKVFPQERVGEVYNERFINAKIDMEKGEGPGLAQRYNVAAYPTYLFVDGDGEIAHKGAGYIPADALIALADDATGDESLGALNKRYDAGERDAEFIQAYLGTLTKLYERNRAGEVIETYLAETEDWSDAATMKLIIANPGVVGGDRMHYLLSNPDAAMQAVGSGTYMMGLQQVLLTQYMRMEGKRMLPPTAMIVPFYSKYAAPLKNRLVAHYEMFQAEQMRDMSVYLPAAKSYFAAYPSNDFGELNTVAWNFYEHAETEADLEKALGWAKQSVELRATYPNLDTLAWLYKKTGDVDMSRETAKLAIEMAIETDQDYTETAELLND